MYEQINVQSMNAPQVYDDPGPRRRLSTKKSDKKGLADQEPQIKDAPPSPSRKLSGRRAPEKANQKCPVEAETRKPINQPLLPPPEIQVEGPSDEGHRHYSVIRRENLNAPASDENRRSRNITAEQFDIITDMFMEYYDDVVPGMYSSQQPEEDDGGTYVNMDEIEEDDPYDTIPGDEAEGTYYAIPDNPKKYNLGNEPPLPPKPQVMKRRPANPVSKKPILPPKPNKPFTKPESSSIGE